MEWLLNYEKSKFQNCWNPMMMAMMGNQGGNNPFDSNPITMMAMTYA